MRRIITLLLVLVMVFSLIACGKKPADSANGTNPTDEVTVPKITAPIREDVSNVEVETLKPSGNVADSNDEYINPEKFGGKTLQIYGISSDMYEDIENMEGQHTFLWMMRAAADEWAALNNVTLSYEGEFNGNAVLGAINAGDRPDLVLFTTNKFVSACNMGITRAFTEEEYKTLSDIAGDPHLNACNYKGQSRGIIVPWGGCLWFRYNETMFENYGAKTPMEYYKEGNWTWETMEDCLEAVTKDFNGNGKIDTDDTYGSSSLTAYLSYYSVKEDEKTGLLSPNVESAYYQRFLEMNYKGKTQTLSLAGPKNQHCTLTTTPRPGTHIGDTEWYNYHSMYRENDLGEVIRAVPMPVFSNEDPQRFNVLTSQTTFMMSSCDEVEATFSLLCYIMKVGMRYMSDFSCGLYKCTYEGLRGASDFSKAYLIELAKIVKERGEEFAAIEDWDQELYKKMIADVLKADPITNRDYSIKKNIPKTDTLPPASATPLILEAQKAYMAQYNSLYINTD